MKSARAGPTQRDAPKCRKTLGGEAAEGDPLHFRKDPADLGGPRPAYQAGCVPGPTGTHTTPADRLLPVARVRARECAGVWAADSCGPAQTTVREHPWVQHRHG
ncbi:hypothetical protein HPB50_004593 [Hyalomma asiaticum]|uniref:Uncharacterized protein n=1 Tax=Hyalomma asiaticum TaxID=266040 RepID=A0ACB7TEN3_HYAAI|nr:hypothetical protein HPB50_004593 [Hyalomma asiaticum]